MSEDIATVTRLQGYTFELRVDEQEAHQMRGFACSSLETPPAPPQAPRPGSKCPMRTVPAQLL